MSDERTEDDMLNISTDDLAELGISDKKLDNNSIKALVEQTLEENDYDIVFKRKIESILDDLTPMSKRTNANHMKDSRILYNDDLMNVSKEVIELRKKMEDMEDAMRNMITLALSLSKQVKELKQLR